MPKQRTTPPAPYWIPGTLRLAGIPVTQTNIYAMELWSQQEGTTGNGGQDFARGGSPRYNWLNSILAVKGSTNCGSCSQQSVQDYPNATVGMQATAQTLQGWPQLVQVMRNNGSLRDIWFTINTMAPGPCAEAGCRETGNATYPGTMLQAIGGGIPNYSGTTNTPGVGGGQGGASGGGSTAAGWCNQNVSGRQDNLVFVIPHTDTGLSKCQLKAMGSAALMAVGGFGILVGLAIVGVTIFERSSVGHKVNNGASKAASFLPGGSTVAGVAKRRTDKRTASAASDAKANKEAKRQLAKVGKPEDQKEGESGDELAARRKKEGFGKAGEADYKKGLKTKGPAKRPAKAS